MQKLEAQVAESEKTIVSLDTQVELKQASIRDEENRAKSLEESARELKSGLEAKTKEVEDITAEHARLKTEHEGFQQRFNNKQELLQTLQTGLADSANTSGGGYLGQLADAKARLVQAETEEEQLKRQVTMVQKELNETRAKWKQVEKEASEGAKSIEKGKQEIAKLKRNLESIHWNDEKEAQFSASFKKAREDVRALTEVSGLDGFYLSTESYDLSYTLCRNSTA